MKILSNEEYNALIKKIDEKDNSEAVKPYKEQIEILTKTIEDKDKEHARDLNNITEDNNLALARKESEIDTKIAIATQEKNQEITELTIAKNNAEQKAEILETAFKNLGFDVKDMKGILDKLVDGLVAKNAIQIIGRDS